MFTNACAPGPFRIDLPEHGEVHEARRLTNGAVLLRRVRDDRRRPVAEEVHPLVGQRLEARVERGLLAHACSFRRIRRDRDRLRLVTVGVEGLEDELGQLAELDLALVAGGLDRVLVHRHDPGTATTKKSMPPSATASSIRCSLGRRAPSPRAPSSRSAAAGATAERIVAVPRHLDELESERGKQLGVRRDVVATERARVVVRHAVAQPPRLEAAALDQLEQELGVQEHLPGAAEVRVLVLERVVRVRVGGDDPAEAAAGIVSTFSSANDAKSPSFRPPDVVAGRLFAVVEDPEVDPRVAENPRERLGVPLVSGIERGRSRRRTRGSRRLACASLTSKSSARPAGPLPLLLAERVAEV